MRFCKYLVIGLILLAVGYPAFGGQQKAKLPASAYLKSAKIAMLGNPPRYEEAMQLLDTLLFYYGSTPEAYFIRGNIFAEYASRESDMTKKVGLFIKMSSNYDSMATACNNKDLKTNVKNDCKKFAGVIDSIRAFYWREDYNEGIRIMDEMDTVITQKIKVLTDSSELAAANVELEALGDSGKTYFSICAAVDPSKYRSYEGIALIYDRLKQYDSALVGFRKASEMVPDSGYLIQNIAYGYIQLNDWNNAIEYFKKYLKIVPDDANTLFNLSICYSNLRQFDSSHVYDMKVIGTDSTNGGAYIDIGQYFLVRSQDYSDSIKVSKDANKTQEADKFTKLRDAMLDSSGYYFGKGIQWEPENEMALQQYSVVMMVRGKYDEAEKVSRKLTEMDPGSKESWINLGDILVQEQKFCDAITPYEKAAEIDPGDAKLWEVLRDIYTSCNSPDKAKKAEEKMEELKKL
jgi:tetratricopeptide (TPR) repeat protein